MGWSGSHRLVVSSQGCIEGSGEWRWQTLQAGSLDMGQLGQTRSSSEEEGPNWCRLGGQLLGLSP